MPFTKEVEEQLDEWGLTPEEKSALEPILGKPERQEKVKGSHLRQSEFSRKMQALDKQKQEYEASIAEKERLLADDFGKLSSWKESADKTVADTAKALEQERVERFKLQQKMQTLAAQYGVDPKDIGLEEPVQPPPKKEEPTFDATKFMSKEEAELLMKETKANPFIAAELEDIVDEHRSLFNKGLNRKELVASALKNGRTLRDEWEEQNKVSDRRRELQEKAIEERIKSKVDEERTKILSEHKLPVTRGADTGSPILSMREKLTLHGTDRAKPSQEPSAVEQAVQAYNAGKYRVEKTG
jgi:hypothetical protein